MVEETDEPNEDCRYEMVVDNKATPPASPEEKPATTN